MTDLQLDIQLDSGRLRQAAALRANCSKRRAIKLLSIFNYLYGRRGYAWYGYAGFQAKIAGPPRRSVRCGGRRALRRDAL
jgi:hypothetical protein